MRERGRDHVGRLKRASAGVAGFGDPGDLERRAVGADAHARDVAGGDAHLRLQRERAVDGGEGVAAAGVVLDRHAGDVEVLAERGERALPVGPAGPSPIARPKPASPSMHVERTGDALGRGERGGDARFGGAPGVQRLGHRVHAERLLQAGGKGRDGGERVREARLRPGRRISAAAAAAPKQPMVPVLCQ